MLCFTLGCGGILASTVAFSADSSSVAAPASRATVERHVNRLSVSANNVPWSEFLPDLKHETGIQIRLMSPLNGTLTTDFKSLPLQAGLRIIFRDMNLALFYAKGGSEEPENGRLTELWLWPKEGGSWEQNPEEPREALEGSIEAGEVEALRQALLYHDQSMQAITFEHLAEKDGSGAVDALLGLSGSEEPRIRRQALSLLMEVGQEDGATVVSALGDALADGDEGVRNYAIEALASWGSPAAMGYLRQALHDPDPFTRTLVVESVAELQEGLPLIQEAVSDTDPTVRSTANFWFQRRVRR